MSSFENTLARMKDLYSYGKDINESKKLNTHSLEYKAEAANGVTYGIIRENKKFYIKSAPKGKEAIAEAYDYLGGFCNKAAYEYTSYADALKNFELKMASINEACEKSVNIETLDPFRSHTVLAEATQAMKDEIARQRQIMHNAAMLMEESNTIGASRKDDTVKFDGKQPEAETGKRSDEDYDDTKANPEYAGSKTNGVDKKVAPFNQGAGNPKDQLKEDAGDIGDAPLHPNTENWGTEGIGKGEDPEKIGWDMEGQEKVNEEEEDWASKGLPATPGVGEADTDQNNDPFTKNVNEEEEADDADVEGNEDVEADAEDADFDSELDADGESFDVEDYGDDDAEDVDLGMDDEEGDDFDTNFEFDDEAEADNEPQNDEISELQAKIDELQAQLDALKGGEVEDEPMDDEPVDDMGDEEEMPMDDEPMGDEPMDDMGNEEGFDGADEFGGEDFADDEEGDVENDFDAEDSDTFDDDDELDEENFDGMDMMNESKRKFMNSIVNSVVEQILAEDTLHVFGKHPGYQKKPMELPTTGEDKNQWGEDWNDESVHSEAPFGEKIGDGDPFNEMVDAITDSVIARINEGKKKVK